MPAHRAHWRGRVRSGSRRARDCGRGIRRSRSCRDRAACAPSLSTAGPMSSRSHAATSSAIVQRNVAGGETTTFARSGRMTPSRSTASRAPHSPGSNQDRQRLESRDFGEPELTSRWFRGRSGRRLRERRVGFLRRRKLLGNGRRKRRRRCGARDLRRCPLRSDLHGRGLARLDAWPAHRAAENAGQYAARSSGDEDKSLHATLPAQCQDGARNQDERFKLSAHFGTRAHCTLRPRHYGIFIGMGPG